MVTDIFISHASEDKAKLTPLLKALDNFAVTYWVDHAAIDWGERWLNSIQNGLVSTKIVLLYVTKEYLEKEWTTYEMQYAVEQEKIGSLKVLPIIAIEPQMLRQSFPELLEKNYLTASVPVADVARRVTELLGRRYDSYWTHHHRPEYSGRIWIKLRAKQENEGRKHRYTIDWGPWHRGGSVVCRSSEAIALLHSKGTDGLSLPLQFEVHPECYVSFGEGSPGVATSININNFWIAAKNGFKLFVAKNFLWK